MNSLTEQHLLDTCRSHNLYLTEMQRSVLSKCTDAHVSAFIQKVVLLSLKELDDPTFENLLGVKPDGLQWETILFSYNLEQYMSSVMGAEHSFASLKHFVFTCLLVKTLVIRGVAESEIARISENNLSFVRHLIERVKPIDTLTLLELDIWINSVAESEISIGSFLEVYIRLNG